MYYNKEDILEKEHEVLLTLINEADATAFGDGQISGVLRFVAALLKKGDDN